MSDAASWTSDFLTVGNLVDWIVGSGLPEEALVDIQLGNGIGRLVKREPENHWPKQAHACKVDEAAGPDGDRRLVIRTE